MLVKLCALLALVLSLPPTGPARAGPLEVGEVTFMIGRATLERGGKSLLVERGVKIQVDDVLVTAESGHLHIRFIDGALVSLRPASQLQVETYHFDAQKPADSSVKFTLTTGSVRAISGEAAEAARERFRLNTPFVAIGVRGTDFVTRVDGGRVAAVVNQGAIVFAPIDSICLADALGPCNTNRAKLITADMQVLVEFARNQTSPTLRPLDTVAPKDWLVPAVPEEPSNALKRSRDELEAKSIPVDELGAKLPQIPVAPLLWGRWTSMALYGNVELVPPLEAIKEHTGAIGTENFSLFRYGSSPLRFDAGAGVHTFRLDKSSANFIPANSRTALPASVTRGTLSVDFGARTFGTYLDLLSGTGKRGNLLGIGRVDELGTFYMDAPDARVRGAVGPNADTAGLTFERSIDGVGKFHGVTLWGK